MAWGERHVCFGSRGGELLDGGIRVDWLVFHALKRCPEPWNTASGLCAILVLGVVPVSVF